MRVNRTKWEDPNAIAKLPKRRSFLCDRATRRGLPFIRDGRPRKRNKRTKACHCKAEIVLKKYDGRWVTEVKEGHHTHGPSITEMLYPTIRRRARQLHIHTAIKDHHQRGKSVQDTLDMCRDTWPNVPITPADIYNIRTGLKRLELGGRTSL